MENEKENFMEKLKGLVELGRKKKNLVEYTEITDAFKDMPIDDERIEHVRQYLESQGIDVLQLGVDDAA